MSTTHENEPLHSVHRVLDALEQCLEQQTEQARENLELAQAAFAVAALQQEQALERVRCLSEAAVMMKDVEAILDAQAWATMFILDKTQAHASLPHPTEVQRAMAADVLRAEKLPPHDFFPDL